MKNKIKLFDPFIDRNEKNAINEVLKSHFWASGSGDGKVRRFENSFRKFVGSRDCVAVNSGTAALNLGLSLFDLKNKEVILPSLGFVSTAHSIIINGGKPIFIDVEEDTLNMDAKKIEKKITSRTAVILPVHFAGLPCKMNEISEICNKHRLNIIEDAAHAAGSEYQKKKIGSHGDAVCFSFHPVKNLAMPTGGIISLNHKNYRKMRKILEAARWCGITDRKGAIYDVKSLGNNYYMNEFSAAIGLTQLKKLNKMNKIRKNIASIYDKEICLERKIPYSMDCSYHIYWIQVNNREKFRRKMEEMNIETGIHYKPIHTFTMYKNTGKLPITEKISKKIVSLPIHPNLTENDIDKIIVNVNRFAN